MRYEHHRSSPFRWQQIGSMETSNAKEIKAQTEKKKHGKGIARELWTSIQPDTEQNQANTIAHTKNNKNSWLFAWKRDEK